jgi:hypothetical protein
MPFPYTFPFLFGTPGGPGSAFNTAPASGDYLATVAAGFGIDVLCIDDLDPYLSLTTNALAQDSYHAVTNPLGAFFWATTASLDIGTLLSQGITPSSLQAVQSALENIITADARTAQCQVTLIPDYLTQTIAAKIAITTAANGSSFPLVINISNLQATLLNPQVVTS